MRILRSALRRLAICQLPFAMALCAAAQSVGLPAPRLLTTLPMGAQTGTSVEVAIKGEHIDGASELLFSHPGITAKPLLDKAGKPVANKFTVTVAKDVPAGVHEARVMTDLGLSSSRAFNVGSLPEVTRTKANTTLEAAMPLALNSVCNATTTARAVDHYSFQAKKDQRIMVDLAAPGIDSKLKPVVIVADAEGRDLMVERLGGVIDFKAPADGAYIVKVHELTFQGGPYFFYRLALSEAPKSGDYHRMASTKSVSSVSWNAPSTPDSAKEAEPNNDPVKAQKITLPCEISGSFFPAADVDNFEFEAKKGETWWVEVASERLGRPTDPFALVQHVGRDGDKEKLTDVAELNDIASPVKVSSNQYAYDAPPYNSGSPDILGKIEIKQDGLHRLALRDLFGGTRNDPNNVYRLIIRQAQPDFALASWAMHMTLRNGDRNCLSKPIALRAGATMAFEVVVIRKDGFTGEINLGMDGLPQGVTAAGIKIPANKTKGIMLITAGSDAPRGAASATMFGVAEIDGKTVRRPVRMASMAWPVKDHWQEIPSPRLLADIPVSVTREELAPLTIAPAEKKVWEAEAGSKLTIPLKHTRRMDFSGANINASTFGAGFESMKIDLSLKDQKSEAVIDLAKYKVAPGDYVVAFYGGAVAKYKDSEKAKPRDIADIVVTEPIPIRVKPKGK